MVFAPREKASLETLVQVAGQCWQIEQGFQMTKGECGLAHNDNILEDLYPICIYNASEKNIRLFHGGHLSSLITIDGLYRYNI